MPRLYFAAPLFCDAERAFNAELTTRIEALGIEVFLPQRDGFEKQGAQRAERPEKQGAQRAERPGEQGAQRAERPDAVARAIFAKDRDEVFRSDILLFVLDGRVPDEGAAVELGLAYADRDRRDIERPIIGLMTDSRSAFPNEPLNAMLFGALDEVHTTVDTLLARLSSLVSSR